VLHPKAGPVDDLRVVELNGKHNCVWHLSGYATFEGNSRSSRRRRLGNLMGFETSSQIASM
jgi:hypothetical protein